MLSTTEFVICKIYLQLHMLAEPSCMWPVPRREKDAAVFVPAVIYDDCFLGGWHSHQTLLHSRKTENKQKLR